MTLIHVKDHGVHNVVNIFAVPMVNGNNGKSDGFEMKHLSNKLLDRLQFSVHNFINCKFNFFLLTSIHFKVKFVFHIYHFGFIGYTR